MSIADPVTYQLGLTRLGDDFITSPGLDNKVGAFVVMEAAAAGRGQEAQVRPVRRRHRAGGTGPARRRTSCYGIDPLVGIAVDVTHATDNPGADKKMAGDVALGKGAVIDLGAEHQPGAGRAASSRPAARRTRFLISSTPPPGDRHGRQRDPDLARGVAAGLISIPNRYMHTQVEMCSPDGPGGVCRPDRGDDRENWPGDRFHAAITARIHELSLAGSVFSDHRRIFAPVCLCRTVRLSIDGRYGEA